MEFPIMSFHVVLSSECNAEALGEGRPGLASVGSDTLADIIGRGHNEVAVRARRMLIQGSSGLCHCQLEFKKPR